MGCSCSRSISGPPEAALPRSRPTVAHRESPDTGRIESKQGSAESQAFRECFSVLADGITDPGRLAIQLFSKELIGPDLRTEAQKQGIAERVKIERLLSAIEAQIETSPNTKFKKFIDVLQSEPSRQHLATKLKETHYKIANITQPTHIASSLPIDTYASYLKSVYTREKLPIYDKWPQIKSKKYINLALIEKEDIPKHEVVQFMRATIHGNIDDIKKSKRATNISQVAQLPDGSQPKCILVDGAPGVGKSTFAWKLCHKWGKRNLFQQYQLVVLLRLRDESVRAAKNISNLFRYHDHQIQQAAVEEITKLRGKGVLLLFEGYDELPQEMRTENSVFLDVIMGRELPEATVLITSRPWASEFLHDKCKDRISQHIEILGFTKAEIQSYVESTTVNDPSLQTGLKEYISCYPHIGDLMYIPLNSVIVVEVYRNSRKDDTLVIPKTMTELYSSLVRSLLLRYLLDHPVHGKKRRWRIRSFSDLPQDVYQQLCELCRIAYEGIIHGQQVIFSDLPEDFETLGLMQCTPELYVDEGAIVSHNFLHLTVQEYLAAFHLSQQPVEEQIEHCRKFKEVRGKAKSKQWDHLQMMLRFLSGLGRFQGYSDEILSTLCIDIKEFGDEVQHEIIVDVLHWLFEAQEDDVFATLLGSSDIQLHVQFERTPFDYFVLGYCVSHSNCTWMIGCIENEGVEMFVRGALEKETHCTGGIAGFGLFHDNIFEGMRYLLSLPKHLINTLKEFCLQYNKLDSATCADLANLMPDMPHLEGFVLSDEHVDDSDSLSSHKAIIGVEDCRALCELLSSSTSLKELWITDSALSPEAFELVINGLHHNTTLETLAMMCPYFPLQIIISLASMLRTNHTLVHLELGTCNIESDGAYQLASALSLNNTLQRLHLTHTPIGIEEATAFAEIFRTNYILAELHFKEEDGSHYGTFWLEGSLCTSQKFYMSGNQVGAMAGAAETLLKNKSLKALKLCYYDSIASALCTNNTLQKLWLWDNSVGVEGATALAKMLHMNKSLKELNLQGNDSIGEEGAKKLIDSLKQNATLGLLVLPKDYKSSFTRSELDKRVIFSDQIPFW